MKYYHIYSVRCCRACMFSSSSIHNEGIFFFVIWIIMVSTIKEAVRFLSVVITGGLRQKNYVEYLEEREQ